MLVCPLARYVEERRKAMNLGDLSRKKREGENKSESESESEGKEDVQSF